MIVSQLALLFICLRYAPDKAQDPEAAAAEEETLSLHQDQQQQQHSDHSSQSDSSWFGQTYVRLNDFGSFLELFAALVVVLAVSYFIFGGFDFFVSMLGILALGIESAVSVYLLGGVASRSLVLTVKCCGSCLCLNS